MQTPAIPYDEMSRLKNLHSYEVIDTSPESSFDELLEIATQLCECPTAMISFVDNDRQWFKSKINFKAADMAREFSFCGHTILKDEVMMVNNAREDERFFDNPAVINDPNICFYAGAPIVSQSGFRLGSVCVIDTKPHELSAQQQDGLKNISTQVSHLLELRLKNIQLSKAVELSRQETEKNLRNHFLHNEQPQFMFDPVTLVNLDVNQAALKLYGFGREEFLQLQPSDIKYITSVKKYESRLEQVRSIKDSHTFESVHLTKLKKHIAVEVFISSFKSGDSDVRIATIKDLSKENDLKTNLSKVRLIRQQKEKETALLRKEKELTCYALQENINQILASAKLCLGVAKTSDKMRMEMIEKGLENVTLAMSEVKQLYKSLTLLGTVNDYFFQSLLELALEMEKNKYFLFHYTFAADLENTSHKAKALVIEAIRLYLTAAPMLLDSKNIWLNISQNGHTNIELKDDGTSVDNKRQIKKLIEQIETMLAGIDGSCKWTFKKEVGHTLHIQIPIGGKAWE